MFNPDQPIQNHDEDRLGRWPFAESFAEAILKYDGTESIAIGLYGSWGTGKTSVLNLVKKYIEEKSTVLSPNRKPVVVDFNPWHYSDQNQLIALFFKDLSTAIRHSPGYERGERIAELVDNLHLYFLTIPVLIPTNLKIVALAIGVSRMLSVLSRLIKKSSSDQAKDLNELKRALDEELILKQSKIIIIIDDIDRLNSIEIRQIFQLVKSLADFKNTIYVLAFDKQVVLDALDDVQKAPGQLYVEKIIPVSFDIVSPGQSEIGGELHDRLKEILADRWDEKVWEGLYNHQLRHFFSTLRDVTRFINTFGFTYALLADDVQFRDLAVITAIQVHEPAVYSKIYKNRHLFAGEYPRPIALSVEAYDKAHSELKEQARQECEKIFKDSIKVPPEQLREILSITFPKLDAIYSSTTTEWDRDSDWRRSKRICSPEYFNRYFKLVLSEDEFSQKEIDSILSKTADAQQFLRELERLKDENRLAEFFETLQFLDRSNLLDHQISIVMTALLHIDDIFSTAQPDKQGWAVVSQVSTIVSEYSRTLDALEKRYRVLLEAVRSAGSSLFVIVWTITSEHEVHGKYDLSTMRPKFHLELLVVDGHQLDELERLVSTMVLQRASDGQLLTERGLPDLLYEWRTWATPEDFNQCIGLLTSDDHLIDFIASFHVRPDEILRVRNTYRLNILEEMADISKILPRIRSISESSSFEALEEDKKGAIRAIIEHHNSESHAQAEGSGIDPDSQPPA